MGSYRFGHALRGIAVTVTAAFIGAPSSAQVQLDKVISDDPDSQEFWGAAVGIDGTALVVGNDDDALHGTDSGSVEFFRRSGADWTQLEIEDASDGAAGDRLGYCVAISGGFAVAGAPEEDHAVVGDATGNAAGAVYVYRRFVNLLTGVHSWSEDQKLIAFLGQPGDRFGTDVAIDGDYIVVGAPTQDNANGVNAGLVYIYHRGDDGIWDFQDAVSAPDGEASDNFGEAVDIDGDFIVVGATGHSVGTAFECGAAYIYRRDGTEWVISDKVIASDRDDGDEFGGDVAIHDEEVAIGARLKDNGSASAVGAVYIYSRVTNTNWSTQRKLLPPGAPANTFFGSALDHNGEHLLVGGSITGDTTYLYRNNLGTYTFVATIVDPDAATNQFGVAISLDANGFAAIGDVGDDHTGLPNPGAVYVWTVRPNGSNTCSLAFDVGEGTFYGSTVGRTNDGDATCGSSNSTPDVWYDYTASCHGRVRFTTSGSAYDTVLSVQTPGCSNNEVFCNDDISATDRDSRIDADGVMGQVYRVRVSGFNGAVGAFVLSISHLPPPNDSCANAAPVAGELQLTFGTCGAGDSVPDETGMTCDADNDIWYDWTPGCTGTAQVSTCEVNFDTEIIVFNGSACPAGPGEYVICNDDAFFTCGPSGTGSRARFPVVANQHYIVRVGGFNSQDGSGVIDFTCEACPCDWNGAGGLDSQDFFDFLDDFFNGDADFNGADGTDSQDYFDFLECFFIGCS